MVGDLLIALDFKSIFVVCCMVTDSSLVPLGANFRSADVVLIPCDTYTFCCGQDKAARDCCDSGNGSVRIPAGSAMFAKDQTSGSGISSIACSSTILATATVTTTASSSISALTGSSSCDSQKNATIGVGAGLGATLLVVAAAAAFFAYKWRSTKRRLDRNLGVQFESPGTNVTAL
jgi:hypothetical protein